jgi:hypothetical protein
MAFLEEKLLLTKQVGDKHLNIVEIDLELTEPHFQSPIFQLRLGDNPDVTGSYENFAPSPMGDILTLSVYTAIFGSIHKEEDFRRLREELMGNYYKFYSKYAPKEAPEIRVKDE